MLPFWSFASVGIFCTRVEDDPEADEVGVKDDALSDRTGITAAFWVLVFVKGVCPIKINGV